MRWFIVTLLLCLFAASNADAHTRHHHHRHYVHFSPHKRGIKNEHAGIILIDTAAGAIRVAADYAERFKTMIADFAAAGYHMTNVHCFARGGHVRHSKHYLGQACDFNQRGWGKTDRFMYTAEAAAIIRRHGFTNGCSFHDCGHVGTDGQGTRYAHRTRYAHHRHQHYARTG